MTRKPSHFLAWADKIKKGYVPASQEIKQLISHVERLLKIYEFRQSESDRYIRFIQDNCLLSDLTPVGDRLLEVHKVILELIFGFYDPHGNRLIREAPIMLGRGQAKTRLASWITTAELIVGTAPLEAKIVSQSVTQAEICYHAVRQQFNIKGSLLNSLSNQRQITLNMMDTRISDASHLQTKGSTLMVVSNNPNTLDGFGSGGGNFLLICDEFAAFKMNGKDPIETLRQGGELKNPNCLIIFITTNNFVRNDIFDEYYARWKRVLSGKEKDDHCLPFLFKADTLDDVLDDTGHNWLKAMPALNELNQASKIRETIQASKSSLTKWGHTLTKYFNLPLNSTASYFTEEECQGTKQNPPRVEKTTPSIIGCDLAIVNDLSAFCALSIINGKRYARWLFVIPAGFYTSENVTAGLKNLMRKFQADGLVTVCDTERMGKNDIKQALDNWLESENIEPICYAVDPWEREELVAFYSMLEEKCDILKIRQNARNLSPAMKNAKQLLSQKAVNFKNDLASFCLENVQAKVDANENVYPRKENKDDKIDGALAFFNAISALLKDEDGELADKLGGEFLAPDEELQDKQTQAHQAVDWSMLAKESEKIEIEEEQKTQPLNIDWSVLNG